MAGAERKENKGNEIRRNSKPIVFPQSYYTINRTTTTTTTLELNYHRRNSKSIMSSSEGVTALMLACLQNRANDVQSILKKNKDSYKNKTKSGKIPLHFCAEGGSLKCLEIILTADPSLINTQDEEGYTPIHLAVINGNKEIVKALISAHPDLNCVDNEKHSLVHWATVCGELDILDILLNAGAPASTPDIHMAHPIHYASQMCGISRNMESRARVQSTVYGVSPKKGLSILRRFIQHGVPIDVKDKDGRQPLLWAASAGSADGILSLVNAGASVQAEDKDGLTALHCAASRGHTDCLETLIALCGAEVDVIDNNGCTALFYAITLGHADCTELLLNFGAEPNRQDRKGRTPAHCGASKGQLETIKLYTKHGGNLWMKNVRGDLPLHEAVISGRKDLVLWILSQRPEAVNSANNDGRCPIHLAALNNNVEMVKILIDHHADVNPLMRTAKGIAMTPLDGAIHKGNSTVAKFLQLHGGLPANSLNDAAHQRRMNRTLESQARSVSSLRGTELGHHEFSPDLNNSSISPERSTIHQYADSMVNSILKQTSIMTSTPVMDNSVAQTDASHYLRDMHVQTSICDPENTSNQNAANHSLGSSSSAAASSDKRLRKKRKSFPRERSPRKAHESTTDSDGKPSSGPTTRLSSRKPKAPKSKTPPSDAAPASRNLKKNFENASGAKQLINDDNSSEQIETTTKEESGKEVKEGIPQHTHDSDSCNNESEKFPELFVAQSSESEAREEEFGPVEANPTGTEQPNEGAQPEIDKTLESKEQEMVGSEGYHPDAPEKASSSPDQQNRRVMSTLEEESKEQNPSSSSYTPTGSNSTSKDSPPPDHLKGLRKNSNVEEDTKQNADTTESSAAITDTTANSSSTSRNSLSHLEPTENNDPEASNAKNLHLKHQRSNEAQSSTSTESRDKGTDTLLDDGYEILSFDDADGISLQEAYARRRKSRSKHSESPNSLSKSKNDIPFVVKMKSRSSTQSAASSNVGSSKCNERLSVREQFRANREKLEKSATSLGKGSEISAQRYELKGKEVGTSEEREHFPKEEAMKSGKVSNSIILHSQQSKIPKTTGALEKQKRNSELSATGNGIGGRQRNVSEGKASTQSEDTPHSWKRDSGYSDQVHHTTSASEDQNRLSLTPKSTGSLRRKVMTRRPVSGSLAVVSKKYGPSSAKKRPTDLRTSKDKRRLETSKVVAARPRLPPLENESAGSTSHGGSVTSEEGGKGNSDFKRRINRPRSKLTFTKGEDLNATMSPYQKRNMDVETPISVTQAMQQSMRKYQLERKIFQELLELKRLQIRAGKANEQVLVKRLADGYKKAGLSINYREYDGAYTFRNFEKYLYDQLRLLQANRKLLPRFAPSDDLEKLSVALKKMNATKLPFLEDDERPESLCLDEAQCTHLTHRCHHASHAYVGIPCAAYIGKGRKTPFLPKVDPLKGPGPTMSRTPINGARGVQMIISPRNETSSPITVEVQQGSNSQVFSLPNNSLDPTKNYYVSLSINPSQSPIPVMTAKEGGVNAKMTSSSSLSNGINPMPDDSGSLSAPPPAEPQKAETKRNA